MIKQLHSPASRVYPAYKKGGSLRPAALFGAQLIILIFIIRKQEPLFNPSLMFNCAELNQNLPKERYQSVP